MTRRSELARRWRYLINFADLALLLRLRSEFADMLCERGIKDAERMPNSIVRAKECLSFCNRLSAIQALPQ
jgi:hypothetical protein